jgi:hypothetical protein
MRPSRLLSKHSTNAANIQESNIVNYFNLCATIWKVRIFERTPAIRNSGRKSATNQKRWQMADIVCFLIKEPQHGNLYPKIELTTLYTFDLE